MAAAANLRNRNIAISQERLTDSREIWHRDALVFSKYRNFKGQKGQEGQKASSCQISRQSVKPLLIYGHSSVLQDGDRSHVGLLKNFKILTVERLKSVELHHCTKFSRNRSNCCLDMAMFRFFQNGGRPPSWIYVAPTCAFGPPTKTARYRLVVVFAVQNLVEISVVFLKICEFQYYASLA